MIRFISSWVTHSHLITFTYSSTALSLSYTIYSYCCTRTRTSLPPLVVSQQRLLTKNLPQSHTSNVTHKVFNSHDPLISNYEPSKVVSQLELNNTTVISHREFADNSPRTIISLSYKPLIWHAGKLFNCFVTADAVTWPFPTLASSKCL
jgi:hypothetical protein